MIDVLTIAAVTAAAFVGTNLDNLILLIALYSRYLHQSKIVTAGYIAGMFVIGLIVFFVSEAGDFIPVAYLGSLGIIPVVIGLKGLFELYRKKQNATTSDSTISASGKTVFLSVFMTQLSNSADTIITFTIFQFDSKDTMDYVISSTFLVMIFVFAGVAFYSLKHRNLRKFLDRFGHWITPFILIFVGLYIISDTATDLAM